MKKRIISICLLGLTLVLICACTSTESPIESTKEEEVHKPVTLDIVAYKYSEDSPGLWLGPYGIKEEFNKEYPWISLNIDVLNWQDAAGLVESLYNAENPPDLFLTDNVSLYRERGMLEEAGEYIPDEIANEFHPEVDTEYAIPFAAVRRMLFINRNLLDGPDTERVLSGGWGEFSAGLMGIKVAHPSVTPFAMDFTDGGGYKTYLSFLYNLGSSAEALRVQKSLYDLGLTNENPPDDTTASIMESFEAGNTAVIMAPEYYFKKVFDFEVLMREFPGGTGGLFVYDSLGVSVDENRTGEEKEAIKNLISFIYGPMHEKYLEIEGFSNVYLSDLGPYKPYPYEQGDALKTEEEAVFAQKANIQ